MNRQINREELDLMRETDYVMSQPELVEDIRKGEEDLKKGKYEIVDIDKL